MRENGLRLFNRIYWAGFSIILITAITFIISALIISVISGGRGITEFAKHLNDSLVRTISIVAFPIICIAVIWAYWKWDLE